MTAAALVTQGYTLADVGTDHGYIPIYLLQQKKIPAAIAMDINEGPLERAKEHIALYGLQAYIQKMCIRDRVEGSAVDRGCCQDMVSTLTYVEYGKKVRCLSA